VKEKGIMVIAANNVDTAPIGSHEYKTLLHLLKILGPDRYVSVLRHQGWLFTKDQWEPEMWGKPIRKVGEEGLIYCAPHIPKENYAIIPGISGYECIDEEIRYASTREKAQAMCQNAVTYAVHHPRFRGREPTIAFIAEGPYAIPVVEV
jgi:hypothetical protein